MGNENNILYWTEIFDAHADTAINIPSCQATLGDNNLSLPEKDQYNQSLASVNSFYKLLQHLQVQNNKTLQKKEQY